MQQHNNLDRVHFLVKSHGAQHILIVAIRVN